MNRRNQVNLRFGSFNLNQLSFDKQCLLNIVLFERNPVQGMQASLPFRLSVSKLEIPMESLHQRLFIWRFSKHHESHCIRLVRTDSLQTRMVDVTYIHMIRFIRSTVRVVRLSSVIARIMRTAHLNFLNFCHRTLLGGNNLSSKFEETMLTELRISLLR